MARKLKIKSMQSSNRKNVQANKPKRTMSKLAAAAASGLDKAALDYSRMLLDPCHAPLVHPAYPGTGAGFLIRSERSIDVNWGTNERSGCVHWVPSAFAGDATTGELGNLYYSSATAANVALPMTAGAGSPAGNFLLNTATTARAVAACMQLIYAGSELNRSGFIYMGHTDGLYAYPGQGKSADDYTQALPEFSRTPNDMCESIWRPTEGDWPFTNVAGAVNASGRGALTTSWTGVVGLIRIRLVCVYEFKVNLSSGLIDDGIGRNVTKSSWNDVFNYIEKTGAEWFSTGHGRRVIGTAVDAALAYGANSAYTMLQRKMNGISL